MAKLHIIIDIDDVEDQRHTPGWPFVLTPSVEYEASWEV